MRLLTTGQAANPMGRVVSREKYCTVGGHPHLAAFLEQTLALALFGRIKKSTRCSASQGFAVSYAWVPRSSTVSPTLSPRCLMRASED